MPCLVGIDLGDVRIGIAVSDSDKKIAFPLAVVERVQGSFGFNKIGKLLADREVEGFVVGLPVRSDGTCGTQAEKVLSYVEHLKSHFKLSVVTWDERYSTVIAERHLRNGNVRSDKMRKVVDQSAAQVILQSYLDSRDAQKEK